MEGITEIDCTPVAHARTVASAVARVRKLQGRGNRSMKVICRVAALMACLPMMATESGAQEQLRQDESEVRAALRRLGAKIKRDDEGRICSLTLEGEQITDAALARLKSLDHLPPWS